MSPEPRFKKEALEAFPERMLYHLCSEMVNERCQFFCQGMLTVESEQFLCHLCSLLKKLCVRW